MRKDVLEKWSFESGIFVICPLESLAEKLGIPEEIIEEKLGNIHGLHTVEPFASVRIEKTYSIDENYSVIPEIHIIHDKKVNHETFEPIRYLQKDEMLETEYLQTQKYRIKNEKNQGGSGINSITEIHNEYKEILKNRTNE